MENKLGVSKKIAVECARRRQEEQDRLERAGIDPTRYPIPEASYTLCRMLNIPSYVLHQAAFWLNKDPRVSEHDFNMCIHPLLLEWFQQKLEHLENERTMPTIYTLEREIVDHYYKEQQARYPDPFKQKKKMARFRVLPKKESK